jgi:hypothetical protein
MSPRKINSSRSHSWTGQGQASPLSPLRSSWRSRAPPRWRAPACGACPAARYATGVALALQEHHSAADGAASAAASGSAGPQTPPGSNDNGDATAAQTDAQRGAADTASTDPLALASVAEVAVVSELDRNGHVDETVPAFVKWLKKTAELAPELVAVYARMHRDTFNSMTPDEINSGLERAFNGKDNVPFMAVRMVERALTLSKKFATNVPGGDDETSVSGSHYQPVRDGPYAELNLRVRLGPLTQSPHPSHACPFQHPPARHPGRSVTRLATRRALRRAGVYRPESKALGGPCHSRQVIQERCMVRALALRLAPEDGTGTLIPRQVL